jgi:O-antigen/teichoic acid export membrane protein
LASLASLVTMIKSRIFAFAALEDRYFFTFLSPAIRSFRVVDGFVRNVFVLMTGSTIAMIIPVIAAPILTRLYSPADYGVLALYVSIVSIVYVPLTANYDSAIMLPEKDGDALNLAAVCVAIAFLLSAVLLFASWCFAGQISTLLGNGRIAPYLPLAPLMAFTMALHGTFIFWVNRKRDYRSLAANKIVESVVTPLASLVLGIYSWGAAGLIASLLGGKTVAALMLGQRAWREKKQSRISLKKEVMFEQARRYSDFPLFSAPTSFLDMVALQVPVLLLTKSFGPAVVGLFALTARVLGAPLALASQSIAQVYYQWITEAGHRNNKTSYVLKVAGYLALIASGPVLAAILFSPSLFAFIFGAQWRIAGDYARILVIPLAIKFVVSPLAVIMPATGNIRVGSVWKATNFVTTWVTLCIASHFQAKTFLYVYSVHDSILYACYFFLIVKASAGLGTVRDGAMNVPGPV